MQVCSSPSGFNRQLHKARVGSGTILDVLRLRKPLVVISNPTLLDDHQSDLASELDKSGHLKASTVKRVSYVYFCTSSVDLC